MTPTTTVSYPDGTTGTVNTVYAQGFSNSSVNGPNSQLTSFFGDAGVIVALVLGAVVAGTIALMGLGFGIRHVRKWITGRKF